MHMSAITIFCQLFVHVLPSKQFNYLRQGGYVFAGFCLSVCLYLC